MTIIIDNIITPYEIARYNEINITLKGNLEMWFQKEEEINSDAILQLLKLTAKKNNNLKQNAHKLIRNHYLPQIITKKLLSLLNQK